jgi:hypothetical protein
VPRTRRWQGVPFFVRAPQIATISFGSVGCSAASAASGCAFVSFATRVDEFAPLVVSFVASFVVPLVVSFFDAAPLMSSAGRGSAPRSTMSGGGAGRINLPSANPAHATAQAMHSGATHPRRKRLSHAAQKRPLVHARQRSRKTRSPHSAQKFGLYTDGKSPSGVRSRRLGARRQKRRRKKNSNRQADKLQTNRRKVNSTTDRGNSMTDERIFDHRKRAPLYAHTPRARQRFFARGVFCAGA